MAPPPVGFDLDMTLIDSRRAIMAAFAAVAAGTGVPIDPAAVDSRLGLRLEDELAYWFPPGQVPGAMRIYREHYLRLAGPMTTVLPGARESIAAVRARGARAVATGSFTGSDLRAAGADEVLTALSDFPALYASPRISLP
jgi:phosphoglycolate phosphatase